MIRSDEEWAQTLGAFQAAALGLGSWEEALRGAARATGSNHGQLIGIGADAAVPFNLITDFEGGEEEFAAVNGHDPRVNSRMRIGARVPELTVLSEAQLDTQTDVRRFPDYGDYIRRYAIPFICLTPLVRREGLLIGLSVNRSEAQGEITAEQRGVFERLAPHVRKAVLTQIALQEQAAALVAGALEAASVGAFVCDFRGRVQAVSPLAETLLAEGRLKLRDGRLTAHDDADTRALEAMIHEAAFSASQDSAPRGTLVLRDLWGGDPLLLEAVPVPGDRHGFGFGVAGILIVRRGGRSEARVADQVRTLFGLTVAESQVVAGLTTGRSPAAIADRLGISVNTVRTHIRRVFEKMEVHSLVEVVAAVSDRT